MKNISLILLFCPFFIHAQSNYEVIKDEFIRTCGQMDSISVIKNVSFIDSVAKIKLESGEEQFLQDYGWAYYRKYLKTKAQNDLIVAINSYSRSWEKYRDINSLFHIGSLYAAFDCFMSKKYIDLFLEESKDLDLDMTFYSPQIEILREICIE